MNSSSKEIIKGNLKPACAILLPYCAYVFVFLFLFADSVFSATKSEYVLRAGDEISILVIEHDEFSQRCRIRPDGKINYPVIGEIDVSGLTTEQMVKIMEEKLAPYVNNVVVSISIESYFANRIYLIGAMGRNGEQQIFEPVDILKVLAMAGGMQNPKQRYVKIIRSNGDIDEVDLRVLLEKKGATQEEAYLLYPGDTLFVPQSFSIPWGSILTIISVLTSSISLTLLISNLAN